jgi:peptide-methionine (S)-S-oxide reductase
MEQTNYDTATFGAGCFWGVEAAYRQIQGVKSTRVGYAGGHTTEPTYREVCAGNTNHAEVVEVTFDPTRVSYEELLDVFWANHDPTQVNRQGPDVGTQYRTVVFFHSAEQEKSALAARDAVQERLPRPIATQIVPAEPFWEAEDYHQQYLEKRGLSTCKI